MHSNNNNTSSNLVSSSTSVPATDTTTKDLASLNLAAIVDDDSCIDSSNTILFNKKDIED